MAHSGIGTALGRASWPPSRNTAPREHRLVSPLIPVRPRSAATPATWLSRSWTPVWPCACRPKEAKTRLSGRPARARSGWLRCWEIPPWLTSKETPRGGLAAERGGGPCLVEYVKNGTVGDSSPPSAPFDLKVVAKPDQGNEITWDAEADF